MLLPLADATRCDVIILAAAESAKILRIILLQEAMSADASARAPMPLIYDMYMPLSAIRVCRYLRWAIRHAMHAADDDYAATPLYARLLPSLYLLRRRHIIIIIVTYALAAMRHAIYTLTPRHYTPIVIRHYATHYHGLR